MENNGLLDLKYFGLQGYAPDDYDDEIGEYNKEADKQHDKEKSERQDVDAY